MELTENTWNTSGWKVDEVFPEINKIKSDVTVIAETKKKTKLVKKLTQKFISIVE